jgi:hypothetical protein
MRVVGVEVLVIEGGERCHHRDQHRHGMGITAEPAEQVVDLVVDHGVVGHAMDERGVLVGGRQLAIEDEIGGLQERAVLGQILDLVAAMQQDSLVAIDIGDL